MHQIIMSRDRLERARSQERIRSNAFYISIIVAIFIATVVYVDPSGNFPLIDDWSYALSTQNLVKLGTWKPSDWLAMPLIAQSVWASPICWATQCGFDDLRLATLTAAALLAMTTFLIIDVAQEAKLLSFLAAFAVVFNPIVYALSFTFMTDVLFSAFVTSSALLYILSLRRDNLSLALLATMFALAATLIRQLGISLPLAYLVVQGVRSMNWRLIYAALPLVLCVASLVFLDHWLKAHDRLPALYSIKNEEILHTFRSLPAVLMRLGHNMTLILLFTGLFCLPISLLTKASELGKTAPSWLRRIPDCAALAAIAVISAALLAEHKLMPFGGNIIVSQGIGPLMLRDVSELGLPNLPSLPAPFWIFVTVVSMAGAFLLVQRIALFVIQAFLAYRHDGAAQVDAERLFVLIAVMSYFGPLLLIPIFDRYFMPALPLAYFFLAKGAKPVGFARLRSLCRRRALYGFLRIFASRRSGLHDLEPRSVACPPRSGDLWGGKRAQHRWRFRI